MTTFDNASTALLIERVFTCAIFKFYLYKLYNFSHNIIVKKLTMRPIVKTNYYSELRSNGGKT